MISRTADPQLLTISRLSPDDLHRQALLDSSRLTQALNAVVAPGGAPVVGLTVSTRLIRLDRYIGPELGRILNATPTVLSRVRLALQERVPTLSLHIGVARIGWGSQPLLDVLHDTTDSSIALRAFCNVQYEPTIGALTSALSKTGLLEVGTDVPAY